MRRSFPWSDFLKRIAVIAVPVALQNLLTTTGSMVDTMMLSRLPGNEVGAVGLCAQFSSLMFSGYWGFVGGGMLFFSQYYGAKDDDGINRSYGLTAVCIMTVGILFGLAAILFPQQVIALYSDDPDLRRIGAEYLAVVGFAYPLQAFAMAMASLLRCTDRVRIPLYASVAAVAVNILLNYCLIFGHLGLPAMGVRGAALATVIAQAVNVIIILYGAALTGHPYLLAFRQHFRWNGTLVRGYFRKCFPILCNEILIGAGNMVINVVLGRQPVDAVNALSVFRTLEGLIIGFFAGFSNAASILVGKEVGAGQPDVAYRRAWRLVYLCQLIIGVIVLSLVALHGPILTMMNREGESFRYGFGMIAIFAVAGLIRMGNWVQNDTYRSAGDAFFGTVLEIAFMWAMVVPCVCLAGFVFRWPTLVVFALCYVDEPIRYVLMQRHLYSGRWIKPVTPEGARALERWQCPGRPV